jgi:NTE family protein
MSQTTLSDPVHDPYRSQLAIVLSGGGARAAYQVGLLRCLAERLPQLRFSIITGTSAGAINASLLASHQGAFSEAVEDLSELWRHLTFDRVFRTDSRRLSTTVARWSARLLSGGSSAAPRVRGLLDTSPLRSLLQGALTTVDGELIGTQRNLDAGRLEAFALTTINYGTGQTVTWVQGRDITTWERPQRISVQTRLSVDHVMASSALPILFPAVRLGGSWFGDGGIRQAAPLAPSIHLGADRILAISTRYPRSRNEADQPVVSGYPPPAQVIGVALNAVFLDALDQDALNLQRINDLTSKLSPKERGILRPVRLEVLRPSVDLGRLAGDYEVDLPGGFRFLTRGLGTRETRSPDFLSMLMFHPEYLVRLMEIGERDAEDAEARITALLGPEIEAREQAAAMDPGSEGRSV